MAETTISISRPDGTMTPPVSLDTFKAAVEKVTGRKGRPKTKPDPEMDAAADKAYGIAAGELRQFVERYERLQAEKDVIADQQKEVMAEAKGRGYDVKALKKIIALRKRDAQDVAEEEAVLEMYKAALGM